MFEVSRASGHLKTVESNKDKAHLLEMEIVESDVVEPDYDPQSFLKKKLKKKRNSSSSDVDLFEKFVLHGK